jgi:hypothetical protein
VATIEDLNDPERPNAVRVTDDVGAIWEVWPGKGKVGQLEMEKVGHERPASGAGPAGESEQQAEAFHAGDHPRQLPPPPPADADRP